MLSKTRNIYDVNKIIMNAGFMGEEDTNITQNIRSGKRPNKNKNHYAVTIDTVEQLVSLADSLHHQNIPVLDKSESGVYPKYLIVPDKHRLEAGDIIRIYTTSHYPVIENTKQNLQWTKPLTATVNTATRKVKTTIDLELVENTISEFVEAFEEFVDTEKVEAFFSDRLS